jgi:hypothetical protein
VLTLMLLSSMAAAPIRLVHTVAGVPVGVIELEVRDGQARYRSRHVFRGRSRQLETVWTVDERGRDAAGLQAELASLWRFAAGCRDVREERTGRRERLCVEKDGTGSIDEGRIRVTYEAGTLHAVEVLRLGRVTSRFDRTSLEPAVFGDPFARGFDVSGIGSQLALAPAAKTSMVQVVGLPTPLEAGSCLELASAWVERHGGAIQLGVVVESGRAWPHAWVLTTDGAHVDPSIRVGEERARSYLAFEQDPGSLYLELVSKARRVVRAEP